MVGKIKKSFSWIICKILPSCQTVTELASRSLETDLSWRKRLAMKLHFWVCVACNRYFVQIRFMKKVFALQDEKLQTGKIAPALSPDAIERLKEAVKSSKPLLLFILTTYL